MGAQTLATIKAQSPDSLWHFLAQIPASVEAQIFYAVLLFGVIGMSGSWLVKWANDQAACGWLDYFFRTAWKRTVATFCTYIGAMGTGIGTGVFFATVNGADVFVGWYTVLWMSITTAFGADMGINKGTRAQWTEEERKAKGEQWTSTLATK